jgi:hypothetical protein
MTILNAWHACSHIFCEKRLPGFVLLEEAWTCLAAGAVVAALVKYEKHLALTINSQALYH